MRALPLGFTLFFVLLLSACSGAATVDQPIKPTPVILDLSPTQTIEATGTVPEPTTQPAPDEKTPTPLPTEQPTVDPELPTLGSTHVSEVDQMEQVYVPAGEFIMGTDDEDAKKTIEGGRAFPENPEHSVYLDGYWMDKFEVTNGQYALCVDAGACQPPFAPFSDTRPKYYGQPEFSNYPVMWVNWSMARAYCEWAGRRLPTEAEWEKAARGTDGRTYPWGNDPVSGEVVNFCDKDCPRTYANKDQNDGYPDTSPVGSFPAGASPYGALDMAGNVWEWTSTVIDFYPYDATDGREDPDTDGERVWRGGPWSNGWWWMRTTLRYRSVPTYWYYNLGFRCAASE